MIELKDLPRLSEEDELELEAAKLPFGGLLGNSVLLRVIEEIVADPCREFRPKNLKILAASSAPRIKAALDALTDQGLLEKTSLDSQRPVYKANLESKRLTVLTLLAYAVIDDRDETDCMNQAIKDYCGDMLGVSFVTEDQMRCNNNMSVVNYNVTYNVMMQSSQDVIDLSRETIPQQNRLEIVAEEA
jgi:hypothetical protein